MDLRGFESTYEYDADGNLITKTEAVGTDDERVTTYTYDGENRLLTATVEADLNTEASTTTFTYDAKGNVSTITDPETNTTEFLEYDVMGNLLRMKDPGTHEWTFAYDDMGRLTSQTDPLTNSTAYEYDGANNRKAIINAYLKRFEFEYDDHNNLIKSKDPYEKYVLTEYNTDDLPTKIADQEGKEGRSEYDNEGRLVKTIDGAGNDIRYFYDETDATPVSSYKPVRIEFPTYVRELEYDNLQRLIKTRDILDAQTEHVRSYTYDAAGNVTSETDEEENVTTYGYDALSRLVKVTDALTGEIKRTYDDRGNLLTVEDPNNGFTRYAYDRNNRLKKVTKPMGEETAYEYDGVGNRTAVIDAKGQRIEYDYNEINRLTQVRYFNPVDHVNPVKVVDFTYDKLGNIETYADGTTSASYTYDDLQRKVSETVDYGAFTKTIRYDYYANGLKKSYVDPGGVTYTYTYDANNRPSSIHVPGEGPITYNDYKWNSPIKVTLPGGASTEYTYDPLMRVKTILATDPAKNPVVTREYQYSPLGNVTDKVTEHGTYTYEYDKLNRLTEAENPTLNDESYTYDAIGNRLTSAAVTGNWNYNLNNELLGFADTSFNFDDNGNMTRKTVGSELTFYTYDVEDRLVKVEDSMVATVAEYYYDPFGRRLWKEVEGVRTYFVYSDEGLIAELDNTGNEIKSYGYMPDSQWGTDPLFVRMAGQYYWYRNDAQGTPQKIVDTSGRVVWAAVYDSFGNCQVLVDEIINNLRFAGQYYDQETGLHYNLNRYYDPKLGRYLRTDPFGDGLNLYSYCFSNPNSWIDPEGLCAVGTVIKYTDIIIAAFGKISLKELLNPGAFEWERYLAGSDPAFEEKTSDIGIIRQRWKLMYAKVESIYDPRPSLLCTAYASAMGAMAMGEYGGVLGNKNFNIGSHLKGAFNSATVGGGIKDMGVRAAAHYAKYEGAVHPTFTLPLPFTNKTIKLTGTLGGQAVAFGADLKFSLKKGFHVKASTLMGFNIGMSWDIKERE